MKLQSAGLVQLHSSQSSKSWAHLEGAAVLGGHNVAQLVHHLAEAVDLLCRPEALHAVWSLSMDCGLPHAGMALMSWKTGQASLMPAKHIAWPDTGQSKQQRLAHIRFQNPGSWIPESACQGHTCENTRCRLPSRAWPKQEASW